MPKDGKNSDKQPHIWKNIWWQMPQRGNSYFDTWVRPKNSSGIGMFGIAWAFISSSTRIVTQRIAKEK